MTHKAGFGIAAGIVLIMMAILMVLPAPARELDTRDLNARLTRHEIVKLNWQSIPGAKKYTVYRAVLRDSLGISEDDVKSQYRSLAYKQIATTRGTHYADNLSTQKLLSFEDARVVVYFITGTDKNDEIVRRTEFTYVKLPAHRRD